MYFNFKYRRIQRLKRKKNKIKNRSMKKKKKKNHIFTAKLKNLKT
jgi:hypothetical protein